MIPPELRQYKQWVCWTRVGRKQTKLPISPVTSKPASCIDPITWGSYRQARATAERLRLDGIGFVFTTGDPYAGVDLDHCRTIRGGVEPWAQEIVLRLNSYTEWSPSGEGLHILVRAALPACAGRRSRGVEVYSSRRYFRMTGNQFEGTPATIQVRQAEFLDLFDSLRRNGAKHRQVSTPAVAARQGDEELLERTRRAKNGAKFHRLGAGDTSDYGGDHSRADAALCSLLTYYTSGDEARIDRLFRLSGLYRAKWDRPTAGSTYGALTIRSIVGGSYR